MFKNKNAIIRKVKSLLVATLHHFKFMLNKSNIKDKQQMNIIDNTTQDQLDTKVFDTLNNSNVSS